MILVINSTNKGIDLVLGNNMIHIDTEKQATTLPSVTEQFLQNNNISLSELQAIGIVVGPGSFTGIRIGIAYAKGLSLGLNIPVVPINAFELYLAEYPNAFVALDSGRGDFFVGAKNFAPRIMQIEELETKQMEWPMTVGHKPFDLRLATSIILDKLKSGNPEPVIPMYLRPSYAEEKSSK